MKIKFIKVVISIIVCIFLISETYFIIYHQKIDCSWEFNNEYKKIVFKNGKEALSDFDGNILTSKFDFIFRNYTGDSLTVFIKDGKRGFLNLITQKVEISPIYEYAWQFDPKSGLAAVCLHGKIGFIDPRGEILIPFNYAFDFASLDYNEGFIFNYGTCVIPHKDKHGLINIKNEFLLPVIYDDISNVKNQYRIISIDKQQGLYNEKTGLFAIPVGDRHLSFIENGIVVMEDKPISNQYLLDWQLNQKGKVFSSVNHILKNDIINSEDIEYDDNEDELPQPSLSGFSEFVINGKYGILDDLTGKVLCMPIFDDIAYQSEGIFKATIDGYIVIVDQNGNAMN